MHTRTLAMLPLTLALPLALALALVATLAHAAATGAPPAAVRAAGENSVGPFGLDNVECQDLSIEARIDAQNLDITNVDDNYNNASYVTQQLLHFTQRQQSWIAQHMPGSKHANRATYRIAARYCQPKRGLAEASSLLVATHGVGFDSSYWDYSYKPSYSFVRHAASHGYASLIYDRLGTGRSQSPSTGGFNTVQAPTEVAILTSILTQAKNTSNIGGKKHPRIVAIGHSYGSAQSLAVSANNPELLDGLVLTGFSTAQNFTATFILSGAYTPARTVADLSLQDRAGIWLAESSKTSTVQNFLDPSNIDQASLDLVRRTEQPVTLGTYVTLSSIVTPANNFSKPVYVLDGDRDLPFCGTDCSSTTTNPSIPDAVKQLFPIASNFSTHILPNTGHAIVPHRSGPQSHQAVLQWILSNKL